MIVAFDNTFLSLVFNPDSQPRPNPSTGQPVELCKERVDALVDSLSRRGATVIIPTPCFSEMLCAVPELERATAELNRSTAFYLAPFDERCAVDLAEIVRRAIASGDKRGGIDAPWNEIKFDRQIAITAKVNGAEVLYSDDITQTHTWDLDLPPGYAQGAFDYDAD